MTAGEMCDWEEFLFSCNHSTLRLKSYCHFARNDPNHQCHGVKVLRNSWQQGVPCDSCAVTSATTKHEQVYASQLGRS